MVKRAVADAKVAAPPEYEFELSEATACAPATACATSETITAQESALPVYIGDALGGFLWQSKCHYYSLLFMLCLVQCCTGKVAAVRFAKFALKYQSLVVCMHVPTCMHGREIQLQSMDMTVLKCRLTEERSAKAVVAAHAVYGLCEGQTSGS